jgi:hypothetical protein
MIHPRRSPLLIVLLAVGLTAAALPGRAQQDPGRFFFADTTLLRDTLDLHFDGLFELADSLRLPPDTLRSISVRFRFPLARIIWLADSLGLPVDSVGPVMLREQFNPLASTGQRIQTLGYSTSYNIGQTSTTWANISGYKLIRGPLFLNNNTNINMDRFSIGGGTALRQTRNSVTELGWKLSPDFSFGGRANLERFNQSGGSLAGEGETKNEFQLSGRSRQRPQPGVTSELNVFTGFLDLSNSTQEKRGLSSDVNGRFRISRGWFTQDLTGQFTGNLSRTAVPGRDSMRASTSDNSQNLRGTLGLFPSSPVGANVNYTYRRVRFQTPTSSGAVQELRTANNGVDMNVRVRQNNDALLNFGGSYSNSKQSNNLVASSKSSREDLGFTSDGRYRLFGILLDARFGISFATSEFPQRSAAGGYGESLSVRTFEMTAQRSLTPKLLARAVGSVSLNRYRYYSLGAVVPVPRDQYRQSYRLDGTYTYSPSVNTGLALEVSRALSVNIPSATTGSNNEVKTYRAEWRWTYHLLPGLTANQSNQVIADYKVYTFNPLNNGLSLDYSSRTVLNAVVTPRLTIDIIHNARYQPSGDYLVESDGNEYFGLADESESFTLQTSVNYSPTPLVSLTLTPEYQTTSRSQTVDGVIVPQRSNRTLTFSGGANVNIPVGQRGRLTGSLRRTYRGDRSTGYVDGLPIVSPRSEVDYWNGSMNFTWDF